MTHSAESNAGTTCPDCGWHTAYPEWVQHACPAAIDARCADRDAPSRWRKKPVEIEAMQFNGNARTVADWCGGRVVSDLCVDIDTLEGVMSATHMDWIIKGIHGEFYPCKPDIFVATYECVTPRGGTNA